MDFEQMQKIKIIEKYQKRKKRRFIDDEKTENGI